MAFEGSYPGDLALESHSWHEKTAIRYCKMPSVMSFGVALQGEKLLHLHQASTHQNF
jgi:hypothetical protein